MENSTVKNERWEVEYKNVSIGKMLSTQEMSFNQYVEFYRDDVIVSVKDKGIHVPFSEIIPEDIIFITNMVSEDMTVPKGRSG